MVVALRGAVRDEDSVAAPAAAAGPDPAFEAVFKDSKRLRVGPLPVGCRRVYIVFSPGAVGATGDDIIYQLPDVRAPDEPSEEEYKTMYAARLRLRTSRGASHAWKKLATRISRVLQHAKRSVPTTGCASN